MVKALAILCHISLKAIPDGFSLVFRGYGHQTQSNFKDIVSSREIDERIPAMPRLLPRALTHAKQNIGTIVQSAHRGVGWSFRPGYQPGFIELRQDAAGCFIASLRMLISHVEEIGAGATLGMRRFAVGGESIDTPVSNHTTKEQGGQEAVLALGCVGARHS